MEEQDKLVFFNKSNSESPSTEGLLGYPTLQESISKFIQDKGLQEYEDVVLRGAIISIQGDDAMDLAGVTEHERAVLLHEREHRWSQPWSMYALAVLNSISAAVQ